MKKNKPFGELFYRSLKKTLLTMRIAVIFMILGILQANAKNVYSQNTKFSFNFSETELVKVLDKIEAESEFFFLYNEKLLDTYRKVSITANDQLINVILDNLFTGTDVKYTIIDRKIILAPDYLTKEADTPATNQQQTISGVVTDSQRGEAMPGVNVVIKGSTLGTMTDITGNYSLSVPDRNVILAFSFIGYVNQEIPLEGRTSLNVALVSDLTVLDEVVIVGYSTQSRKSLTGAVSTVSAKSLSEGTSSDPITRLQGKASGVNIVSSHVVGAEAAVITIRGLGTMNDNTPLYVIDGVPTKSGMSQLNPDEIESITVLKDATSAAIYGARGANGVIIITTKRGTSGKTQVTFNAQSGISSFTDFYDLLNTEEYGELLWMEAENQGKKPSHVIYGTGPTPIIPDYVVPAGKMEGDPLTNPELYNYNIGSDFYNITRTNKKRTDWWDAATRKALLMKYSLGLSGGQEKSTYSVNVGYSTEEGILQYTSFDQYSIRANSDFTISKWLTLGESLGLVYTDAKGNRNDNAEQSITSDAYRMLPAIPVYDIMGNFAGTKGNGGGNTYNPLAILYRDKDDFTKNIRNIGNIYANFQIIKGLNFKTLFGFDYRILNSKDLTRKGPEGAESPTSESVSMSNRNTLQWNWTNTLNYRKTFGSHSINLLIGTEAVSSRMLNTSASRSQYFSDDVMYMYLDAGQGAQFNSGGLSETKTASYFGRLNYDFKSKYLAEFTFRRDGSSRFGPANRWGNFPSVSAGWTISEESFMSGIKGFVNNLKLRGGYGLSGNDEIGDYNSFSTFASDARYSFYSIDGSSNSSKAGFYSIANGNLNAKWETTSTMNLGIDLAILNNTLSTTLDIWQRNTKDMLYRISIPYVAGEATAPSVNIGNMVNKGFDFSINYANQSKSGDLTYDIGLVVSHYKNEILKISNKDTEFIEGGSVTQTYYTRAEAGTAYPEFYGLIVDGYFQNEAEAAAYPKSYGTYNQPGHFKFRNLNGDDVIDNNDRTYIGSPHPKFTAGLDLNIGYKAFSLNAFLYSSYGNKLVNYVKRYIDYTMFNGNRSKNRLYKSWGSPYLANNADAILPLADESLISQYPSTEFLEDGSFLRMKSLQLTYTLPKTISQKLTMENLQVFVQGINLFTLTNYTGLDPEINASGTSLGLDIGQWPSARQIIFGIKLLL